MKLLIQINVMLHTLLVGFSAGATELKLALNWKAEPQFGGFYAAQKMFKEKGLNIRVLEGGSGAPTVQMLANGQVDFAIVSAEEILISNERNPKNPVVGVFAVYQINPQAILCHAEKGYKSLKDVFASSSTLAWQSGLSYAMYLRKKFPDSKLKLVPYPGGITNFLSNKDYCQQGFQTSEPLLVEKAGQKATVFTAADEGFNPYTTVLAVRKKDLKERATLVSQVVAAVRTGWGDYLKDPKPTNEIMGGINKAMDKETFAKSAEAQRKLIETKGPLGEMSLDRWQTLGQQLQDLGVLKARPEAKDSFQNL